MSEVTEVSPRQARQPGTGPHQPAIRVILMPKDTNALGTIFGGIILSYIDQAGAVGDLVSFYTETLRRGTTSITVKVVVEVERSRLEDPARSPGPLKTTKVTEAEVVYVHVDAKNRPQPLPALPAESGG
jgi:acyl-CoA thioesterase YciA